jgi:uncharacterized protein (TIGR02679 family)
VDRRLPGTSMTATSRHAFLWGHGLRRLVQRDIGQARALVDQLCAVLDTLVERGPEVSRLHTQLAADVLGNSHALDRDTLLFRALAQLADIPADDARTVWQYYGLEADTVSSTVLTLGLRFAPDDDLSRGLNAFMDTRAPVRLLLRYFRTPLRPVATSGVVFVCENPAVLEAAADAAGVQHPLVCTEGQPSLACMRLLQACAEKGIELRYHGDFDWGGIRIANHLWRHVPRIQAWRYETRDLTGKSNSSPSIRATRWSRP